MSASLNEYSNVNAINEVLGSLILEPALLREYELANEDFPELFHRLIYAAIFNLTKSGADELDAVAIDEYLSRYQVQYQTFTNNNGFKYLETLQQIAKPANIEYNYDQVRKFSLLRRYKQNGIDVSYYFDPDIIDPVEQDLRRARLDNESIPDIINHFKRIQLDISSDFMHSDSRESKKAGTGGLEQLEKWKKSIAWGIGYSSAYLTTIFHGMQPQSFTVRTAGTGVGKTRTSLADMAYACSPYYWDPRKEEWARNPNGTNNAALFIGTEMNLATEIDPILWAYIADVPQNHIQYNAFEKGEEERVREAINILEYKSSIYLENIENFTVDDLSNVIEQHVLEHGIRYVFFDYIQSTPDLLAEYGAKAHARMAIREDQVLLGLSTKLKYLARKFGICINSSTQINGQFHDEGIRDQTLIAGAKSISNKVDNGMIGTVPTLKELKKVEPIIQAQMAGQVPNLVWSVYKVRGNGYKDVKVWLYVDYATMRTHDLFVTDSNYKLITDIERTYINVESSKVADSSPTYITEEFYSKEYDRDSEPF